jgi:hypothetical protein
MGIVFWHPNSGSKVQSKDKSSAGGVFSVTWQAKLGILGTGFQDE